jgi:Sulfotransferase domain
MTEQLYRLVYRLPPPPHRTRFTNKPMQILALGLPRSGTDSLRSALLILGYSCVWHGFDLPSTRPSDCAI